MLKVISPRLQAPANSAGADRLGVFDLITSFDAVHDMADPQAMLNAVRLVLEAGWSRMMQDIRGSAQFVNNMDVPFATPLYTISCMHSTPIPLGQRGDGQRVGEEAALFNKRHGSRQPCYKGILRRRATMSSCSMNEPGLNVLITNIVMSGRSGTEIVTRDLALGLARAGHNPTVYTQRIGPIGEELKDHSIPVTTSIDGIGEPPDIIHAHHTPVAAVAVTRFPDVPAVFLAHDFVTWHDTPPIFTPIRRYLAVDTTVAERLYGDPAVADDTVEVVLNAVDMARFPVGPPLPSRPEKALAFAKNRGHVAAIKAACDQRDISLDVVGAAVGRIIEAPEETLQQYDLVFTSALSAIEAMACGRAVIVCDGRGLAGLVTPQRFEAWRPMNFGLRTLSRPVTATDLVSEIDGYDPVASSEVCRLIRQDADTTKWIARFLALYKTVIAEHRDDTATSGNIATEASRHLEKWAPTYNRHWPWMVERNTLLERIGRLTGETLKPQLPGKPISFANSADRQFYELVRGFSEPGADGVWTVADSAVLIVRVPSVEEDAEAVFEVSVDQPRGIAGLAVDIMIDGKTLTNWSFAGDAGGSPEFQTVQLRGEMARHNQLLAIEFRVAEQLALEEQVAGNSGEPFRIKFVSLTFQPLEALPVTEPLRGPKWRRAVEQLFGRYRDL